MGVKEPNLWARTRSLVKEIWRTPSGVPPRHERDFVDFLTVFALALLVTATLLTVFQIVLAYANPSSSEVKAAALALAFLGGLLVSYETILPYLPRPREAATSLTILFVAGLWWFITYPHWGDVYAGLAASALGFGAGVVTYYAFQTPRPPEPNQVAGRSSRRAWPILLGLALLSYALALQATDILLGT